MLDPSVLPEPDHEQAQAMAPPERRPRVPFVVVPWTAAIQADEDGLGLALTTMVGGTRPQVSVAEVQDYLRRRFDLLDDDFDVRHHYPEDFIVRFRHGVDREQVLASRISGVWLPLVWRPWRRQSLGHAGRFKFKVVVALSRVPLHARNLEVAQTVLGPTCAEVNFSDFRDRPLLDDREFFVSAWCWHPSFIHSEQVIFIPDPHYPGVVVDDHLLGLRYLVRARLVAYQDWSTPPPSPGDNGAVAQGNVQDKPGSGAPDDASSSGAPRGRRVVA